MSAGAGLIAVLLLVAVVGIVTGPLRARLAAAEDGNGALAPRETAAQLGLAELEAMRDAKYREIRDAELDFRTGKLTAEDHAAIDHGLRAEALATLDRIDALLAADDDAGAGDATSGPSGRHAAPTPETSS